VANDFLTYTAGYLLEGGVLKMKRALTDCTHGNVCSPALQAPYEEIGDKIMEDLKSRASASNDLRDGGARLKSTD
jgi:hypothetical protein